MLRRRNMGHCDLWIFTCIWYNYYQKFHFQKYLMALQHIKNVCVVLFSKLQLQNRYIMYILKSQHQKLFFVKIKTFHATNTTYMCIYTYTVTVDLYIDKRFPLQSKTTNQPFSKGRKIK